MADAPGARPMSTEQCGQASIDVAVHDQCRMENETFQLPMKLSKAHMP